MGGPVGGAGACRRQLAVALDAAPSPETMPSPHPMPSPETVEEEPYAHRGLSRSTDRSTKFGELTANFLLGVAIPSVYSNAATSSPKFIIIIEMNLRAAGAHLLHK